MKNQPEKPMQEKRQVSPAERAMLFARATRQNMIRLASQAFQENNTITFNVPKTRYLSRVLMNVQGTFRVTHALNATFLPAAFAPYTAFNRVRCGINNGFNPFAISGRGLYWYNRTNKPFSSAMLAPSATAADRPPCLLENAAAVGGAVNKINFTIELPHVINQRDPVGLILAQNEETIITYALDCSALTALMAAPAGFTIDQVAIQVTPLIETFSIPVVSDHRPDLSVIKLVHEMQQDFTGAGDVTVKIPPGLTFRKILWYVEDAVGVGVPDANLGDFTVIFNQADYPYVVSPSQLAFINAMNYGGPMEPGLYCLDFTDQGIPNLGGARDYVDTERLTEFWLRTTAQAAGRITLVYEMLTRMKGA